MLILILSTKGKNVYITFISEKSIFSSLLNKVKHIYKEYISLKELQRVYLGQGPMSLGPGLLSRAFSSVPRPRNVLLPLVLNRNKYLIPVDPKITFG